VLHGLGMPTYSSPRLRIVIHGFTMILARSEMIDRRTKDEGREFVRLQIRCSRGVGGGRCCGRLEVDRFPPRQSSEALKLTCNRGAATALALDTISAQRLPSTPPRFTEALLCFDSLLNERFLS
jgi:hypothetical protein